MFWLRIAISIISVGVIIGRILFPNIIIDSITLGLLIVAILPWLSSLIESAEFPGGWKIKFRDIKKAVETAATIDTEILSVNTQSLSSTEGLGDMEGAKEIKKKESFDSVYDVLEHDANLRLVALRIDIEKRLRRLARKYKIEEGRPLDRILGDLVKKGVLESSAVGGLKDLISVGNRAAHGAKVEYDVANWAANTSGKFLYFLDRKIDQAD